MMKKENTIVPETNIDNEKYGVQNNELNSSKTCIEYYFLFLIAEKNNAGYDQVYEEAIEILKKYLSDWNLIESGGYEEWTKWKRNDVKLDKEIFTAEIDYYKKRIFIKFNETVNSEDFRELFKRARETRKKIENSTLIKELKVKFSNKKCIKKLFLYPFIHMKKDFKPKDLETLSDETQTTFFYEILDSTNRVFLFPKKALIRLSRPSIISTEISENTKNKLINSIYTSCLYRMREKNESMPSDDTFREIRNFIENIFYQNQASIAQIEESKFIKLLSIIGAISAMAGIFSLWRILDSLAFSIIGIILFLVGIYVVTLILYKK